MAATFDLVSGGDEPFRLSRGREIVEERVAEDAYRAVERDVRAGREEAELVPEPFCEFMVRDPGVDAKVDWARDVEPFVGKRAAACAFPFQRDAVCRMVRSRRCLNAASMGCAKTLQALCALAALGRGESGNDLPADSLPRLPAGELGPGDFANIKYDRHGDTFRDESYADTNCDDCNNGTNRDE
ncbi:Hypothetical Protein FCC1311_006192 [Hondaea fermentalgiana]|uniref:Uncharacterized protein n=1 Tax=Hondaea fermentalgiana TaxID=2315210 RepID=A0A2R5G8L9_9STRA|nr:Hypothetical Protein FCC1311_006192 [Hondaea fermentalgiana]|eukprot:GBG24401.1 Hypothetical Protein FCC1311_006192 [Hondaea fermentalgiana]